MRGWLAVLCSPTPAACSYTFLHDGGCGGGLVQKTNVSSLAVCANSCKSTAACGYFAWNTAASSGQCSEYTACANHGASPNVKSYQLHGRPGYALGTPGAGGCPAGSKVVPQSECEAANAALTPAGKSAARAMMVGSWAHVPRGCSMQHGGDFTAHFGGHSTGSNPGAYTPICYASAGSSLLNVSHRSFVNFRMYA